MQQTNTREELLAVLIEFTKEDFELIEHGVLKKLDDIRVFIHYLRDGDSDITGESAEKIIDKIIGYVLS